MYAGIGEAGEWHREIDRPVHVVEELEPAADADARQSEAGILIWQRIVQRERSGVAESVETPLIAGRFLARRRTLADLARRGVEIVADVDQLRFRPMDAVPPELRDTYRYTQGQHLTLRARLGDDEVRRSYSICSGVHECSLRIAIKDIEPLREITPVIRKSLKYQQIVASIADR